MLRRDYQKRLMIASENNEDGNWLFTADGMRTDPEDSTKRIPIIYPITLQELEIDQHQGNCSICRRPFIEEEEDEKKAAAELEERGPESTVRKFPNGKYYRLTEELVETSGCGHVYHRGCIESWEYRAIRSNQEFLKNRIVNFKTGTTDHDLLSAASGKFPCLTCGARAHDSVEYGPNPDENNRVRPRTRTRTVRGVGYYLLPSTQISRASVLQRQGTPPANTPSPSRREDFRKICRERMENGVQLYSQHLEALRKAELTHSAERELAKFEQYHTDRGAIRPSNEPQRKRRKRPRNDNNINNNENRHNYDRNHNNSNNSRPNRVDRTYRDAAYQGRRGSRNRNGSDIYHTYGQRNNNGRANHSTDHHRQSPVRREARTSRPVTPSNQRPTPDFNSPPITGSRRSNPPPTRPPVQSLQMRRPMARMARNTRGNNTSTTSNNMPSDTQPTTPPPQAHGAGQQDISHGPKRGPPPGFTDRPDRNRNGRENGQQPNPERPAYMEHDYSNHRPMDNELTVEQIEAHVFRKYRPPMNKNAVIPIQKPPWMIHRQFNSLLNITFPDRVHWDHGKAMLIPMNMLRGFFNTLKSTARPAYSNQRIDDLYNRWLKTPIDSQHRWIMWMNDTEWENHVAANRIDYLDSPWKAKNTLRSCYDYETGKRVPVSYLISNAKADPSFTIKRLYQRRAWDERAKAHVIVEIDWIDYVPADPVEWIRVARTDIEIMIMWRENGRLGWNEFLRFWKDETDRGRFRNNYSR